MAVCLLFANQLFHLFLGSPNLLHVVATIHDTYGLTNHNKINKHLIFEVSKVKLNILIPFLRIHQMFKVFYFISNQSFI